MDQTDHLSSASFLSPRLLVASGWRQHVPFAFWLTGALEPRRLVELGAHYGMSYFAFCQAVQTLRLPTECFAVDTWQGDERAAFYGEEVWDGVRAHNDEHYAGFSTLVRATFDEALPSFADGSIDLLHVDGRHFYEDVRHDFETWLPKVSERGVVLLHDTQVLERGFGVHRFWAELTARFPCFEFLHGYGLGVVGVGNRLPAAVRGLFGLDAAGIEALRTAYRRLGEAIDQQFDRIGLDAALEARAQEAATLHRMLAEQQAQAGALRTQLASAEKAYLEQTARTVELQATLAHVLKATRGVPAPAIGGRTFSLAHFVDGRPAPLRQIARFVPPGRALKFAGRSLLFAARRRMRVLKGKTAFKDADLPLRLPPLVDEAAGKTPPPARPVEDADIACLKEPTFASTETALFVTHSPDGRLKPHLATYLEAFAPEGIGVVLIVAADQPPRAEELAPCLDLCDGVFVRRNEGFDFAAWAHLLRLRPALYDADILYLANDSVIGPTSQAAFHATVEAIRASEGDVVGLTDNYERGWHVQSYFLALKRKALTSYALHDFVGGILAHADKDEVINRYEVKFGPAMRAAPLRVEALFSAPSNVNPTIFHWKELLRDGFPFLKVMAIRDTIPDASKEGWRDMLAARGYDVAVADETLASLSAPVGEPAAIATPLPAFYAGLAGKEAARPRIAFLGPWNYDNGLGVAARGYMSALFRTGYEVNILPVEKPFHVHHRISPTHAHRNFLGRPDVAVVQLNPDAWTALLTDRQQEYIEAATRRVGAFVWESLSVPEPFIPLVRGLDAVWAPSDFVRQIFAGATPTPVDVVRYVVATAERQPGPQQVAAMRGKLGLADGERLMLYAFDASSYLARKNPLDLIRAFAAGGLHDAGWRLVLKTKLLSTDMPGGAEFAEAAAATPGVSLLNQSLSRAEFATLMSIADVYASSHRSEGFGLTIAEAMAAGKTVVATDFGGSRDFLDAETGFPVRHAPYAFENAYGSYMEGTAWAQPDFDHLCAQLAAAAALDPAERARLGARARARIEALLSPAAVADAMRDSIGRLA